MSRTATRRRQGGLSRGGWRRTTGVGRGTRRPVRRAVAEMLRASRLGRKRPAAGAPPDRRRLAPGHFARRARSQRSSARREGVPRPHWPPRVVCSAPEANSAPSSVDRSAAARRAFSSESTSARRLRSTSATASGGSSRARGERSSSSCSVFSSTRTASRSRAPPLAGRGARSRASICSHFSSASRRSRSMSPLATREPPNTFTHGSGARRQVGNHQLPSEGRKLSSPVCAPCRSRRWPVALLGRALPHRPDDHEHVGRRARVRRAPGPSPKLLLGRSMPQQRCEAAVGSSTHRLSLR